MGAKSFQSCATLCDPMDCNPPGSSVHGISQGKILERVAEPSSRDVPHSGIKPTPLCLLRWQSGSLLLVPPGNPRVALNNTNVSYSSGGQKSEMGLQDKIKVSAELHYFGSSKNLFFALSSFWRCSRYLAYITLTSASIIHLFL